MMTARHFPIVSVTCFLTALGALTVPAPAGTIMGTVVRAADGMPVADALIEAFDYSTGVRRDWDYTDALGSYTLWKLPAGRYRVKALHWTVDYVHTYYDNACDDQDATPVVVADGEVVPGIDFRLILGGNIAGVVTDTAGVPIPDLLVTAADYDTGRYRGGAYTDPRGRYNIPRLPGGRFRVRVATQGTDFIGEFYDNMLDQDLATPVVVPATKTVGSVNFVLTAPGLRVSGRVTDKLTHLPLANILVGYWHDDFKIYVTDYTDADGRYELTGLVLGEAGITVNPAYYYARMGTHLDLRTSRRDFDFALPKGASISGAVVDARSGKGLAGILINYWSDRYGIWGTPVSREDGTFLLGNLPPGAADLEALPEAKLGYVTQPQDSTAIYLEEGQDVTGWIMRLSQGALVTGFVKDSRGQPLPHFECDYEGRLCDGEVVTDSAGRYQVRLPVGTSVIAADEDGFFALPREVTVTDVNVAVNVPDLVAYSEQTGGRISGFVDHAGTPAGNQEFGVAVFKAGTVLDGDSWYTATSVSSTSLAKAGAFVLAGLPPGVLYDVVFVVATETAEGMESYALIRWARGVPSGTAGLRLDADLSGSEVYGNVVGAAGQAVLGTTVLLTDSATKRLSAFARVDCQGRFEMHHVKPGIYLATALHSGYIDTSKSLQVFRGLSADAGTLRMSSLSPLGGQ
ncbi:MAG: carboxypeptidase-like regulatory domain-containing protein [Planctomycetes bacterium]|nr:carboxypeptidase-like regulatory domain-containing protein [Planctomycetota bacterium]